MHEVFDQVLSYLKATWRYRWYAMMLAWGISMVGWAMVYRLPDQYEASARVHVDTQSILRPLLYGLAVQPNTDQIVYMMSRTLISRPNLEKVIRMADMDIKLKTPEEREARITQLSRQLRIAAGGENLYVIAYRDTNPVEAKRVVQSLLTIFVEGSLGDKRKDSDSARRFLDEQLKAYNEKLLAADNAVIAFKRKNVGLMPGEGGGYYARLGEAKAAVSQAELELKEAENARDAIKKLMSGDSEIPSLIDEKSGPNSNEPANPELDGRIQALQQKLDGLRLTYTDQHPDIISVLRLIDQLREQKKVEAKTRKSPALQFQAQNPLQQQLSLSLASSEANVASMKARVAEYVKRYEALKGAVNMLPQIDAEYAQLTRDHQVVRSNYDALLGRRESAQMGAEMEANASIVDFRVIDPPQVPSTASAPNRPMLMSLVLLGALGAGFAVAFVLSQLRPTFTDERRLRELSGLPVFGTVVMAWGPVEMGKRRKRLIAFLVSLISLFSAYGAIIATLALTGKG
jgi:polysaccharide chain length determinant protein (PEP-CTERM system associated)